MGKSKGNAGIGCLIMLALPLAWCAGWEPKSNTPPPLAEISSPGSASLLKSSLKPAEPARPPTSSSTHKTTARVNLRAGPSANSEVLSVLDDGTAIAALAEDGSWRQIEHQGRTGWVSARHLKSQQEDPALGDAALPDAPAPAQPAAIRTRSAHAEEDLDSSSGGPVREPYVGRCDCPYDLMRNGRACGGRSAYSRPGGRKPVCYD